MMTPPANQTTLVAVPIQTRQSSATFSADVQHKLATANRAIRWLREQGAAALAVRVDGDVPVITVSDAAAPVLKRMAYRESYRRVNDGHGTEMVVIQDCIVKWSSSGVKEGSDGKKGE